MRKFTVMFALGMTILMAAGAGAVTTDGSWNDWFTYSGDVDHPTWDEGQVTLLDSRIRTVVDEEGPTPGAGGQAYDIEQIFYFFEDADVNDPTSGGTLHVGLVTGFPAEGRPIDDLYGGDLFVGFGGNGGLGIADFDLAIAVSTATDNLRSPGSSDFDSDVVGTIWRRDGSPTPWQDQGVVTFLTSSEPYRVLETGPGVDATTGMADVEWGGLGKHNFLEVSFDVDGGIEELITSDQGDGGLRLHWTMECGNDVIDVQDNQPFTPVPEPSTFALLGMGLLGGLLRKKFTA